MTLEFDAKLVVTFAYNHFLCAKFVFRVVVSNHHVEEPWSSGKDNQLQHCVAKHLIYFVESTKSVNL